MGRKLGKRYAVQSFSLRPDQLAWLVEGAARCGQPVSEFLRQVLDSIKEREEVDKNANH